MLILFGSNYGKDTSEIESSYLIWIIEKYDGADWTLIQACKAELSARLKLEWKPIIENEVSLRKTIDTLTKQNEHLFKIIALSTICKGNEIILQGYINNPKYTDEIISLIKQ